MKESFREVEAGDPVSAAEYNRLQRVAELLDAETAAGGAQIAQVGGVRGQTLRPPSILVVRITAITVPEGSSLYNDSLTHRFDPVTGAANANDYNAIIQVYDRDLSDWVDDPDARRVEVTILDDASGWRPLQKGEILPVVWNRPAAKYVPLETRESAVVMATSSERDADGMVPGVVLAWSSELKTWITLRECYILDIGS